MSLWHILLLESTAMLKISQFSTAAWTLKIINTPLTQKGNTLQHAVAAAWTLKIINTPLTPRDNTLQHATPSCLLLCCSEDGLSIFQTSQIQPPRPSKKDSREIMLFRLENVIWPGIWFVRIVGNASNFIQNRRDKLQCNFLVCTSSAMEGWIYE